MGELDLDFVVKYPFLKEAKDVVATVEITESLLEKAIYLILSALSGRIEERIHTDELEKREWVAVYATSRMILAAMRNRYISNRFATAYSKLVRKHINNENDEGIKKLCDELKIRIDKNRISLPSYLKYTPRDPHYFLINREINNGWVVINEDEKRRILEEAVRKHLEELPLLKNPPKFLADAISEIEKKLPKQQEEKKKSMITANDYPPCVSYLLEELKKHHNLPHYARWFLAVYLINIGLSDDEIVSLFSNLPDFSEKITRYQVEHARKKGYKVPNCSSVSSGGLCRAVCGITNPISWRKKK